LNKKFLKLATLTKPTDDSEESQDAAEILYIDWTRFRPLAGELSDLLKSNPSLFFSCLGVASSQVRGFGA
jgi:hypothetical protein